MDLIFGKNSPRTITLILLPGAVVALVIAYVINLNSLVDLPGILLAIDIVSGVISNATKSTQKAWFKVKNIYRYLFIGFHLTVYPAILFLLFSE